MSFENLIKVHLPFTGDHLRICQQGLTCCTEEMEHKLSHHSKAEFDGLLKEAITDVRNVIGSRTSKFDGKSFVPFK